jgi:hypothetical protein
MLVFSMGIFSKRLGDDKRTWTPLSRQPLKDFLSHRLPWSIVQPLWKRDFLLDLNGFDESFNRLQDVELHTRALFHPGVNYKQIPSEPDCYYRIDDARRNYDVYNYDLKRVRSSLQYFSKFYKIATEHAIASYLPGTIYHTYLQVLFHAKHKQIDSEQLQTLEKELLGSETLRGMSPLKIYVFKMCRFCNLRLPRIPGCNYILNKLALM